MKKNRFLILALAAALFGCQKAELVDPNENGGQPMKEVTLSAGMGAVDTKAALDSETGQFSWQEGDVISVLATDGKFYEFTLSEGNGEQTAEFAGRIPETAAVTTVATYPALVADATENTSLTENTLMYSLPAEWTWKKEVTNVPMVAAFEEGADHMAFKQVGGVMRFPVKNMPYKGTFVLTMSSRITGEFPVDITALGETNMVTEAVAEGETSTLTIHYNAEVDGDLVEFNVPVPTGTYTNFDIEIKDNNGTSLFTKHYEKENVVERATLLVMSEVELPARGMAAPTVWPYFVDARVLVPTEEGVTQYAVYLDGATEPQIIDATEWNAVLSSIVIGGDFAHKSTHTVALAKVKDGKVLTSSKSEAVEFTTGNVMQVKYNTGTRFICAGWDDVAIGVENSITYNEITKKWSLAPKNESVNDRNMRGYRIQLYADDKTTLLYDEVPFSSQVDFGGGISNSSWLGKIGGQNMLLPTSMSFGWLEPNKTYYFRVQTLAEPVTFTNDTNSEFICYKDGASYEIYSTRGGCAWSELVPMTTDAPHVASANEIFHEGFDDMMFNSDIMNISVAAVPEFITSSTQSDGNYKKIASAARYQAWVDKLANGAALIDMPFSEQGFNTMLGVFYHGMTDDQTNAKNVPAYLNKYAGSLEGWSVTIGTDKKPTRTINPGFGTIRLGESGTAAGKVLMQTPPINSDKLSTEKPTRCIVRAKVSAHATTIGDNESRGVNAVLGVYLYRNGTAINEKNQHQFNLDEDGQYKPEWTENYTWASSSDYLHYPTWFEVEQEYYLYKGDVIGFEKSNPKVNGISDYYGGNITIGEVTIEIVPEEVPFEDNGIGTEPDDTDYDVFKLGEFPISYWYTVEPWSYTNPDGTYSDELTLARYQEMKDAGFNVVNYWGHSTNHSPEENKRIHDVCAQLNMKFLGYMGAPDEATRVQLIKEYFGNSDTYVGEHVADEPGMSRYDELARFVDLYKSVLPDKEAYINLFPQYANAATQLQGEYEDYIDQYLNKVKTKSLSYDFYGLVKNSELISGMYYSNLDMVRSKTLARRMPFWVITQGCECPSARFPNEQEQRWSVWSNIAVGSKGISYFCYWTPSGTTWESLIDLNGNKTVMYDWVQKINADINTIGKKLLPCHADGAIMTATKYYPLYDNGGAGRTNYGPVKAVSGSQSILCGCFRDARRSEAGEGYKGYKNLVVSEMPNRTVEAYLTLDPAVGQMTVTHNNTSAVVQVTNTLNTTVGDITVKFDGSTLTLGIPNGEAVLLEY